MELVRRYEVADCAHRLQSISERTLECDGGMDEKVAVAESHHGHPSSKRQRKPYSGRRQILERTIHNTDVPGDRLVLI